MKLICYLSNGYPTLEESERMAQTYFASGVDTIEIDFPSRNPFLESEFIANRMRIALTNCDNYGNYMVEMAHVRKNLPNTDFILMTYENTVQEIGVDTFSSFCLKNGYLDIILVGLQDDVIKNHLIAAGIRVSCYVQFHLPEDEVKNALASNGFTYLQAVPAEGQASVQHPTLSSCIAYLRERGLKNPIYCGVGVHSAEIVSHCKDAGADGVFVGSAILKLQNDTKALSDCIAEFKAQC